MSKWRNTCPDVLLTRIGQGFEAQLYLLRQTGPTGFLVKEHDSDTKFKVLLGSTHSCDCSVFLKEKELCIHIIWIVTRKFRIEKDNPLVYQLGLNERDLNYVIYGSKPLEKKVIYKAVSAGNERLVEKKKEIESDDVCPICQEDIYKTKKTLIHCKFGCGNSVHVNCMKIWADHQLKSLKEEIIKCPLCRTEFSSHQSIVKEYSLAKAREKGKLQRKLSYCNHCNSKVTLGQYYRCSVCKNLFLCLSCFQTNYHNEHIFQFRKTVHEKWNSVVRHAVSLSLNISRYDSNCISSVQPISSAKGKSVQRIRSRLIRSANTSSLPDLSLGVTGINLQGEQRLPIYEHKTKPNVRLPPLATHGGSVGSPIVHSRIKNRKSNLKKEQHLPVEGISDIISVSCIREQHSDSM